MAKDPAIQDRQTLSDVRDTKDVTAIILGGGRGERLYPLTLRRAKPAVGFAGKYRIIDIPISNCINSGVKRLFVLTQFSSASLHRHIMRTYRFDEFTDGFVDILAAEQTTQRTDWFQGPADAVKATLHHTTYYRSGEVLILSGDQLYRMNYADLLREHRESWADITICVTPVGRTDASRMGLLSVDHDGKVTRFVEKPQEEEIIESFRLPRGDQGGKLPDIGDSYLASMGIYVFRPEVLVKLLSGSTAADFGMGIFQQAMESGHRVRAHCFSRYWKDIGTVESFFEANIALAQPDAPFQLYEPEWPIYTRTRSLPPSRIVGSEIQDSLLSEGTQIDGAHVVDSIIGVRSVVRKGTTLNRVVMLGEDFYEGEEGFRSLGSTRRGDPVVGIGRDCHIERAIIDKDVRIGDGVVIRDKSSVGFFQGERYWIRDGITVIPKGAVIPSGTEI
jgi:glucose-1-phosphate adenylyltransferase